MTRIRSFFAAVLCAGCVVSALTQSALAGKWQGETGNGRQIVLDAKVKGQQLSGTFTLAQQTVEINDGKVSDKAFTFKVALDGRTPTLSGELVGEQIKLTVEGVSNPVMLNRAKAK